MRWLVFLIVAVGVLSEGPDCDPMLKLKCMGASGCMWHKTKAGVKAHCSSDPNAGGSTNGGGSTSTGGSTNRGVNWEVACAKRGRKKAKCSKLDECVWDDADEVCNIKPSDPADVRAVFNSLKKKKAKFMSWVEETLLPLVEEQAAELKIYRAEASADSVSEASVDSVSSESTDSVAEERCVAAVWGHPDRMDWVDDPWGRSIGEAEDMCGVTAGCMWSGCVPDPEQRVTTVYEHIGQGTCLTAAGERPNIRTMTNIIANPHAYCQKKCNANRACNGYEAKKQEANGQPANYVPTTCWFYYNCQPQDECAEGHSNEIASADGDGSGTQCYKKVVTGEQGRVDLTNICVRRMSGDQENGGWQTAKCDERDLTDAACSDPVTITCSNAENPRCNRKECILLGGLPDTFLDDLSVSSESEEELVERLRTASCDEVQGLLEELDEAVSSSEEYNFRFEFANIIDNIDCGSTDDEAVDQPSGSGSAQP